MTSNARQIALENGQRTYLANQPCKHGHVPPLRYTSTGACVACIAANNQRARTGDYVERFRLDLDVPEGLSVHQLREWLPELREAASQWLQARMALDEAMATADAAQLQRPDVSGAVPVGRDGWRGL